jgi:hypothetical protein
MGSDHSKTLAPVTTHLENRIADLADQFVGQEAAQEDLRKLVQSGLDGLAQRIDATKQASEAASQRAQSQAVRLAQDELRKFVQSELGTFAQRMDALKQASETAAQRAQNQAVQQAQKDRKDLETHMKKEQTSAPQVGEIGRLRNEMESLGQRVDDLTVKSASEHELDSLRAAIEKLSAQVAHGPDLKPLADFDRRLTEMANKLEQRLAIHGRGQIDAAELDKRIAAAMRPSQASPPWTAIERKLAVISGRLANTETRLQHIATHEKWILQLYRNLEETLDWTRNVAEEAANRMASQLVQEWSSEADPAATFAEVKALENALAAVRTDHENADQRNQEAQAAVNEALEQINSRMSELEQIVGKVDELEQLRDQLQLAASTEVLAETARDASGIEPVSPEAYQPQEMATTARREPKVSGRNVGTLAMSTDNTEWKQRNLIPFKPGQSGNPPGRPKGSRNKLEEDFLSALAADFEQHGEAVIQKVRETKPEVYLRVIADLLPKDN